MPAVASAAPLPSPFELRELEGKPAPAFILPDTKGKAVDFSSYRGRVVLLNFWSSPCPTCTAEITSLNRLHQRFMNRGFNIVSIAIGLRTDDVRRHIENYHVGYPLLVDSSKGVALSLYKVFAVPANLLIDARGTIVKVYLGEQNWMSQDRLRDIEDLLR